MAAGSGGDGPPAVQSSIRNPAVGQDDFHYHSETAPVTDPSLHHGERPAVHSRTPERARSGSDSMTAIRLDKADLVCDLSVSIHGVVGADVGAVEVDQESLKCPVCGLGEADSPASLPRSADLSCDRREHAGDESSQAEGLPDGCGVRQGEGGLRGGGELLSTECWPTCQSRGNCAASKTDCRPARDAGAGLGQVFLHVGSAGRYRGCQLVAVNP